MCAVFARSRIAARRRPVTGESKPPPARSLPLLTTTASCRRCGSVDIVKNGRNRYGNQQYHCKACGAYGVLESQVRYTEAQKEQILRAYQERVILRGLRRLYGVSIGTVLKWIPKKPLFSPPGRRDPTPGRGRGRPGSGRAVQLGRAEGPEGLDVDGPMSAPSTGRGLRRGRPKGSHRLEAWGGHPGS